MTANADPTNQQWIALLDTLSRFRIMLGDFSNEGAGAAGRHDELWAQTAHRLNQMGGAFKSWEKWKEAFNNLKGRAKRQFLDRARHARGTGGGPPLPQDLEPARLGMNQVYCRVMEFIPKTQLYGHDGVADPLHMQMQQPVQAVQQPAQAVRPPPPPQQPQQQPPPPQQPVQAMRPPPPQQHLGQVGHRPWLQHPLPGPERHAAQPGLGLAGPYLFQPQPRHQVAHCVYPATLGVAPDISIGATLESAAGFSLADLGSLAGPSSSAGSAVHGPGPSWAESSVHEPGPSWAESPVPAPGPYVSLSAPPVAIQGVSELTEAVNLLTATLQSLDLRPAEVDTTKLDKTVEKFASTVDTLAKLG